MKSKMRELILQVTETLSSPDIPQKVREELDDLRKELVGMVNPESKGWGVWEHDPRPSSDPTLDGWMQCVKIPSTNPDRGLDVMFFKGVYDGKPVIQIDGGGEFRVNVNDAIIWDSDPSDHKHTFCDCTKKE